MKTFKIISSIYLGMLILKAFGLLNISWTIMLSPIWFPIVVLSITIIVVILLAITAIEGEPQHEQD